MQRYVSLLRLNINAPLTESPEAMSSTSSTMSRTDPAQVAHALWADVEEAQHNGRRASWWKVTTLVNLFGGSNLTESLRRSLVGHP